MDGELSLKGAVVLAAVFGIVFGLFTVGLLYMFEPAGGRATGQAGSTGDIQVAVGAELGIEVDVNYDTINFGTLARGETKDTLPTGSTLPFLIRNIGNVMADVEICANQNLWSGASVVPSDYQFSVANADARVTMDDCVTNGCFDVANSATSQTNMPTPCPAGVKAVNNLNWEDSKDEAIVHIYVHVPADEPAGAKSSTVTFTALDSSTYLP